MLSLYEAAHWETQIEKILDEALRFTPGQLELLAEGGNLPPHISRLIKNSLYLPQRHNNEMIFAKGYISFYEQEEDHDKMLLRFSKLNFRFLQLHWLQELKSLTNYNEPQYSRERLIVAKFFMLYTLVDDTCDRFASFPEAKILAECMERLVPDSVDSLPDYMKPIFRFTLNVFEESKSMSSSEEEESYIVQGALEEEFKILMRSYVKYDELEWKNMVPTFDESMEVKDTQVAIFPTLLLSFLGLGHTDMELAYNWLKSRPKLVAAMARHARLLNDMVGYEDDMSRGVDMNVVNYYMKQHNVSKEETYREFNKMVRDTNKVVNEEFLKLAKTMPIHILHRAINCGIMTTITYSDGDGYANPIGKFKEHITSLFVDLMPL
ncbi:terpenoid synthase 1 [Capsella rubella]|uniref:terpenoid synthase 1 n=1 Tax=Capsella rubella TaxID=81985 RepID=UPI000CD545D9|nr:terpenoid synthase 1 [Capsella rubella]